MPKRRRKNYADREAIIEVAKKNGLALKFAEVVRREEEGRRGVLDYLDGHALWRLGRTSQEMKSVVIMLCPISKIMKLMDSIKERVAQHVLPNGQSWSTLEDDRLYCRNDAPRGIWANHIKSQTGCVAQPDQPADWVFDRDGGVDNCRWSDLREDEEVFVSLNNENLQNFLVRCGRYKAETHLHTGNFCLEDCQVLVDNPHALGCWALVLRLLKLSCARDVRIVWGSAKTRFGHCTISWSVVAPKSITEQLLSAWLAIKARM